MKILRNIVIGGCVMFVGFLFYNPFITYIYTPLYDMLKTMYPDLPAEQELFWKAFPFVLLFAIIGLGIMWIIGKKELPPSGGGTEGGGYEGQ
jgi:hypothetical protein